jgi:hypothetical protein
MNDGKYACSLFKDNIMTKGKTKAKVRVANTITEIPV